MRGSRSACPTMRLRHGTGAEFRTRPLECRRGRALVVLAGSSTADVGTSGGRYTSAPPGPLEGAGRCVMEEAGVVDGRSCRVSDNLGSTGQAGGPPTVSLARGECAVNAPTGHRLPRPGHPPDGRRPSVRCVEHEFYMPRRTTCGRRAPTPDRVLNSLTNVRADRRMSERANEEGKGIATAVTPRWGGRQAAS